jgi:hypothetical protein
MVDIVCTWIVTGVVVVVLLACACIFVMTLSDRWSAIEQVLRVVQ